MLAISQLLLTRFWWNFKCRFLGTSRTDSNCQGDICPGYICPGDIYPYQEYLSCYWPDFDETLKICFLSTSRTDSNCQGDICLGISGISQMLLTRFWWNFKGRFLGTSRTDSYCHGNICQGNICPGDICPYQEFLSSYQLNFDQTLKVD